MAYKFWNHKFLTTVDLHLKHIYNFMQITSHIIVNVLLKFYQIPVIQAGIIFIPVFTHASTKVDTV